MASKKKMVLYVDTGLFGTFVGWEKASDDNYRYLKYVPLDTWSKKVITYEKPIHIRDILNFDTIGKEQGKPEEIVYILSEEKGGAGVISKVTSHLKEEIEELRAKNQSLERKNTSLTQELENARAGMGKAISGARSLLKRPSDDRPSSSGLFDRFRPSSFDDNSYSDDLD